MYRKPVGITRNGYIKSVYDLVEFVAQKLLYRTLCMTFQRRCENSVLIEIYFYNIAFEKENSFRNDELIRIENRT